MAVFRASALILRSYSSSASASAAATRRRSKSLPVRPRPTEIPFQPKVANAVNLIDQVHTLVQFETCDDGNTYAATVITRQESPSSPYRSIPVIFEGDLAFTAKTHLQQNDIIHVAGQLSTDPPLLDQRSAQTNNIQVMVQSLNFDKGYPQEKNTSATSKQDRMLTMSASGKHDINQSTKDVRSKQSDEHDIDKSWKDLLNNPSEWWDVPSTKVNPRHPDFKRKDGSLSLWLNRAPTWVSSELEGLDFDDAVVKSKQANNCKGLGDQSWNDLVENPTEWLDNRSDETNERALVSSTKKPV